MEKNINRKNTIGLTVASFGQCIFISLTSMALPMFFTDVLYIAPAMVSVIFLITRIWDAINDPMMGAIVDKTNTRWGKCRPFLLFSAIPLFIFTIMMFFPINENSDVKFGYYLAAYLLFITSYTALDIPLAGIKPLLFTDPDKRNKAMSMSSTFGSLGSLFAIDLFFIIVQIFGGSNVKRGYFLTVLLLSTIGLVTLISGFFTVKEVVPIKKNNKSFWNTLKIVTKNKYMFMIIITSFLSMGVSGYGVMLPYFAKWNLADSFNFGVFSVEAIMIPILSTVTGIIFMVAVFITPYLLKWISKRKLFFFMSIIGIVLNLISFSFGYRNLYVFMALRFLAHIPPTITGTLCVFMLADTLDYAEFNNGERTEGISYAVNNLVGKAGNAIFSALMLFLLGFFGYNVMVSEPALEIGESIINNYSKMLDGIFFMMTIFPAISLFLQMIPMLFYKFDDESHKRIIKELNIRRGLLNTIDLTKSNEATVEVTI